MQTSCQPQGGGTGYQQALELLGNVVLPLLGEMAPAGSFELAFLGGFWRVPGRHWLRFGWCSRYRCRMWC